MSVLAPLITGIKFLQESKDTYGQVEQVLMGERVDGT
jgi:hypothetical protein